MINNSYIPEVVRIEHIFNETPDIKTFSFPASAIKLSAGSRRRREKYPLDFIPGQFLEVSYFGLGEVPISICSSPKEDLLQISFKRVGGVTHGLFNLKEKDSLGLRGPFGNGFPVGELKGKELIFIAGGIGLAPLRSLIKFILEERNKFKRIILLYGGRSPQELLYKQELNKFIKDNKLEILLTVDKADEKWIGNVGVVTELLNKIKIEPSKAKALICGPNIMMHFTCARLLELGMNAQDIILSLERYMKCGVGKCGHCYIADRFVCRDGPVFTYAQLNSLRPVGVL